MISKHGNLLIGASVAFVAIAIIAMMYMRQWQRERVRIINGSIEKGIMMQMTVDEFEKYIGRYPLYAEFTNVYSFVSSFQQGVTMTNKVTPTFDNSGGWLYNEKSGEVSINSTQKYAIGFLSSVDLSKISFHSPAKITVERNGNLEVQNYSYLNQRLSACSPQIDDVIKSWAATNNIVFSNANIVH
jgi:hypothetical protein